MKLCRALGLSVPCVVMGQDFDEVRLDGQPWAWFVADRCRDSAHRSDSLDRAGKAVRV